MNIEFLRTYAATWMGESATPEEAEAEILATIEKLAGKLAWDFRFGSYTLEDARQEGVLYALQAIAKGSYDVNRPLGGFLRTHIKNRLHNLKRNAFMRPYAPCSCCDAFGVPADPCDAWKKWDALNRAKMVLAKPGGSPEGFDVGDREPGPDAAFLREVEGYALTLPQRLRSDYLRLKAGVELPPGRTEAVHGAIRARFAGEALDAC